MTNNFKITLGQDTLINNPTNLSDGMMLNFRLLQDVTVGRILSLGSKYKFPGGIVPTWPVAASAVSLMSAYYDSTLDILMCSALVDVKSAAVAAPMARFWRILVTARAAGTNGITGAGEIEFRSAGARILTTSAAVIKSSEYNSSYSGANAFDQAQDGNFWASANGSSLPQYVGIDFTTAKSVDEVAISMSAAQGSSTEYIDDFTVQKSDDGATWTSVKSFTGQKALWTANIMKTYSML